MKFSQLLGPLTIGLAGVSLSSCGPGEQVIAAADLAARNAKIELYNQNRDIYDAGLTQPYEQAIAHAAARVDSAVQATSSSDRHVQHDAAWAVMAKEKKAFHKSHPQGGVTLGMAELDNGAKTAFAVDVAVRSDHTMPSTVKSMERDWLHSNAMIVYHANGNEMIASPFKNLHWVKSRELDNCGSAFNTLNYKADNSSPKIK